MDASPSIKPLRVGIAGCGYFGARIARSFQHAPGLSVAALCDPAQQALREAVAATPGTIGFGSLEAMLALPDLDAVVVAAPPHLHAPMAARCLRAGKHVLVEKPMTTTAADAERLIDLAESHDRVLMVDHTSLFTPAMETLLSLIGSGVIGKPRHIHCERANFGAFRTDVNAAWDLAPHDLAFVLHLSGCMPETVNCTGSRHTSRDREDAVQITLAFPGGLTATIHNSWLSPVRTRRCTVVGETGSACHEEDGDRAIVRLRPQGIARQYPAISSIKVPRLTIRHPRRGCESKTPDPLATVGIHFARCIRDGSRPVSDGWSGLEVVRVLEACDRSLAAAGAAATLGDPNPASLPLTA